MNSVKTEQHNGHTIKIYHDEHAESPREWDNLGTMLCAHGRYSLGDKHELSPDEILRKAQSRAYIAIPLYLYDHSGLCMSTSPFNCPWDSGMVGYIMVSREKVRDEYGWKAISQRRAAKIRRHLKAEVKTYSQYLQGDIYGYQIEDQEGNEIDSCWGFYGIDETIEAAKENIEPAKV